MKYFIRKNDFYLICAQNIGRGYTLEPPRRGGSGRSSLTNEKDNHYFLNRFVCVGEFFDG